MKKIAITTVYTGFNFGSSLQAYASRVFYENLGYEVDILAHKGGIVKGRDIRIGKLLNIVARTIIRPALMKKTFLTYKTSLSKEIKEEAKNEFMVFEREKIKPYKDTFNNFKKYAASNEVFACICGSDQIWNATNIYIDPLFYLKFAPRSKRVAYAPSFGKDEIPNYNKNIIKKNIMGIDHISVREEQGVKIIKDLTGKNAQAVIDPTLLLNKEQWIDKVNKKVQTPKNYLLMYFLDKPSQIAVEYIKQIARDLDLEIISIPTKINGFDEFNVIEYSNIGPEQFVNLINDAKFVCTDSFHGMVFSCNLNTPFYIFKRNYGAATDQSSRIVSLLDKIDLKDRFISNIYIDDKKMKEIEVELDFNKANLLLEEERKKSINYLNDVFLEIEKR